MTRRLTVEWPDPRPFEAREGRPIRLLAASDEPDRALDEMANRRQLGPIDLIVGCGDLGPDRLAFLGDAFAAPLVYVRGNHDRRGTWPSPPRLPLASAGIDVTSMTGITLLALPWPTGDRYPAVHDERAAWRQVLSELTVRLVLRPRAPWLVFSHVPPRGAGDTASDAYHVGFAAYRLALDRIAPPLWLHGHTNLAASPNWLVIHGPTTVVNVTGSVLIDLVPADQNARR